MKERAGKFLVFAGFLVSMLTTIATQLIYIFALSLPKIFSLPLGIASLASSIFIVLGFLIMFLAKRRILDILIAAAFAITFVLQYAQLSGVYDVYYAVSIGITTGKTVAMLSLVSLVPYVLWFIKLIRTTPIGAISVLMTILVSLFVPAIIAAILPNIYSTPLYFLLNTVISVGVCALKTLAAYLDMKK